MATLSCSNAALYPDGRLIGRVFNGIVQKVPQSDRDGFGVRIDQTGRGGFHVSMCLPALETCASNSETTRSTIADASSSSN